MIRLKIIALFLSLLMSLQMLPITQIGRMLSSNQWIEELPHNAADNEGNAINSINSNFLPTAINYHILFIAESKVLAYLHSSDQIPSNHSTDVIVQPPNSLS